MQEDLTATHGRPQARSRAASGNFHDWFPSFPKADFNRKEVWQFSPGSFKMGIADSQAWVGTLNDIRRRARLCFRDPKGKVPAVNFNAAMLPSIARVPKDRVSLPIAVVATAAPEDEDPDDKEDAVAAAAMFCEGFADRGSEEILMNTKDVMGWLVSYRSSMPENEPSSTGGRGGRACACGGQAYLCNRHD